MRNWLTAFSLCFAIACFSNSTTKAALYEITASGPLISPNTYTEGSFFDGTTRGELPSPLDIGRLEGGSFRATYRFSEVTPPPSGAIATYVVTPSSGMINYQLLDANGNVVHEGTNPLDPAASVENNFGGAPYIVDQVFLTSSVSDVSGATLPTPKYPSPSLTSVADLSFFSYVSNTTNYLSDLSIPTDVASYLAFPSGGRLFDAFVEFGDGDYIDRNDPYQYTVAQLQYDITQVTVTQVPEPAGVLMLAAIAIPLTRRRHLV